MTVSPTSGWLDYPSHLAPSGPARTRTSVCSNSRALLPLGAAMLGVMRRRRKLTSTRPSMACALPRSDLQDRKSTRLNSSHPSISYAVFCLKKKNTGQAAQRAQPGLVGAQFGAREQLAVSQQVGDLLELADIDHVQDLVVAVVQIVSAPLHG